MKSPLRTLILCPFVVAIIGIASCGRTPVKPEVKAKDGVKDQDPFRSFVETSRYTENSAGGGDDWTRFRAGLGLLNTHFSKPEGVQTLRDVSAAHRKFLETDVHLSEDERGEVESTSFRTADAHYLDECFLLRDAARSLETGETGVKQAEFLFRWLMSTVVLHEQIDSWVPPAATIRRGCGSPIERALVYLALLRQAQLEGCLIVVPDKEPTQFLIGVLDSSAKAPGIYLFDTRLGLPLKSKDGTGVLSLTEALADPALLQPANITPDQAKKLEAWLVCPLYAMSPRMLELQRHVNRHEPVAMYMNAPDLARDVAKASGLPTKVWNAPGAGNSPTRSLRQYVPKQEGGTDERNRAAIVAAGRLPMRVVLANYAQIQFTEELMSRSAYREMLGLTFDFLSKYELQPREMYLRGLHDAMARRFERLQLFVRDDLLDRLVLDQEFRKNLRQWQDQMRTAGALTDDPDPRVQAKARRDIEELLRQDQFVGWMVELNKEEKFDPKYKKTVLTRVLAVGTREHLAVELARSQASVNHERAAIAEVMVAKASNDADRKEARDAWVRAASSWKSYLNAVHLENIMKHRLDQMQRMQFDQQITMLESLQLDVHRYFDARLNMAECKLHREGAKAAREYLAEVKREIEALEKKGLLKTQLGEIGAHPALRDTGISKALQPRLDLLARDWSEAGSYWWLKRQIDRRMEALSKNQGRG